MPSWQILLRYDYSKVDSAEWSTYESALGSPGSYTFESITAASTEAADRTAVGDGQGLYDAFFTMTDVTKIGFMDGSLDSLDPTTHENHLVYNLVESTDSSSVYGILMDHNNYQKNASNFSRNDTVFGTPSVLQHTAQYSGSLSESSGSLFHCNDSAASLPEYFCMTGINRDSDNDIQSLCAYTNILSGSTKGDAWRGSSPLETFWSYWGNDFHSNSQTQRIGSSRQTVTGVAGIRADTPLPMYQGPLYLMGYGGDTGPIISVSGDVTDFRLTVNQEASSINMINTGIPVETWSITPTLPSGLTIDTSTGEITGTPIVYDVVGTTYTVSAADINNNTDTTTLNIKILDTDASLAMDYGYLDTSVAQMLNVNLPGNISSSLSLINIASINNRNQRRSMIRNLFNGTNNTVVNSFRTTKSDLNLPEQFTKNDVIVYRTNQTIDLSGLDPLQGAYSPIYDPGEYVIFLNVGGSQTVKVTALGDGVYNVYINDVDTELTYNDGDEYIIAGVSFIFGSVATEGSNDGGICLTGDANVLTSDGYKYIKDITSECSLPDGNQVNQLVRTVHKDNMYLIKKDLYGHGQPFKDTILTRDHMILCPWTKVYHKANQLPGITIVKHDKPIYVYNIITYTPGSMTVNGLTVETLHHNNINAMSRKNIIKL